MSRAPLSFKVASTLSAYRFVGLSAAETVAYPTTITTMVVGVTVDTVLDTVNSIPIAPIGEIAKVYFNDTVSATGLVASDSSGRGVPLAGVTLTNTHIAGVLVGPAVAATGTIADVLILGGMFYGQV